MNASGSFGAGLSGGRRRRRPELNLVPLIDVLVMLIFFAFVTMQFKSAATLNITLPKMDTAGKNAFTGSVIIGIDKEGQLSFATNASDERRVTDEQLTSLMQQLKDVNKEIPVLIRVDEDAPVKRVTFVMDQSRKVGLAKINLQTR